MRIILLPVQSESSVQSTTKFFSQRQPLQNYLRMFFENYSEIYFHFTWAFTVTYGNAEPFKMEWDIKFA